MLPSFFATRTPGVSQEIWESSMSPCRCVPETNSSLWVRCAKGSRHSTCLVALCWPVSRLLDHRCSSYLAFALLPYRHTGGMQGGKILEVRASHHWQREVPGVHVEENRYHPSKNQVSPRGVLRVSPRNNKPASSLFPIVSGELRMFTTKT